MLQITLDPLASFSLRKTKVSAIAKGKMKRLFEEKTTLIILIAVTAARKGHGNTLNDHQDFCPQALTSTNLTHEKSKHHKMPL